MGVITTKAHTVIGLVVGVLLIAAPAVFNLEEGAASLVPMIIGVFIILNELITTSPFSPLKLVPMRIHIMLDVLTGFVLAASPWLFGFFTTDAPIQWVPHLVVGLMVMGYALLTTTADEKKSVTA